MHLLENFTAALLFAAAVSAGTAQASPFRAVNGLQVLPVGNGQFEVIEARGEGARGMWCAAANFVQVNMQVAHQVNMQVAHNARLYVLIPRGPSKNVQGAKGVTFTLRESDLSVPASRSFSVSVRVPGQGLPVHHAQEFCRDYLIEPEDGF